MSASQFEIPKCLLYLSACRLANLLPGDSSVPDLCPGIVPSLMSDHQHLALFVIRQKHKMAMRSILHDFALELN